MRRSAIVPLCFALALAAALLAAETPEEACARADALLAEATEMAMRGDAGGADRIEEALGLYRSVEDRTGEALGLVARGFAGMAADKERQATEDFDRGRSLLEQAGDPFSAGLVAWMQGMLERQEGRTERALAHLDHAVELLHAIAAAGRPASLDGFLRLGKLFGAPAEHAAQVESFGPMLSLVTPLLAQVMQGAVRGELAVALLDLGRLAEAEAQLNEAQAVSGLSGGLFDLSLDAAWGELRRQQWRLDEAEEHLKRSLESAGLFKLFPFARDRRMEVQGLGRLAEIDALAGRFEEALAWNDRALALAREDANPRREASVLEDRAELYIDQNRFHEAGQALRQALDLARTSGARVTQATVLNDLGYLALLRGIYGEAAKLLEESVSILREQEEAMLEAVVSGLLAGVYLSLQADTSMQSVLTRGKDAARESEWQPAEALLKAVEDSAQAVRRGGDLGALRAELAERFGALPGLQPEMEQVARAVAGRVPDEGASAGHEIAILSVLSAFDRGRLALEKGAVDSARQDWREALAGAQQLENQDYVAMLFAALAAIDHREGRAGEALAALRQAVAMLERNTREIHAPSLLASFLGGRHVLYDALIELLAGEGRNEEAFSYAERSRARALLQQLGNRRLDSAGGDPDLVARADALRRAITRWEVELGPAEGAARTRLEQDITHAKAEHEGLMTRVKVTSPEYASLVAIEPLDLAAVQRSLEPGQTLVSYFVTAKRAHAWVVERERFEHVPLAVGEEELDDVRCFAAEIGRFAAGSRQGGSKRGTEVLAECAEDAARAERLYQHLFAPLKPKILGNRLLVVPHGVLHYLPLAALRDPGSGRYLIEDYTLSYLPSASVLPFLRAKDSPFEGRALVLGAPASADHDLAELPGAADEARQVAGLWGTQPWLGAEATEARLRSARSEVDLIHLAAHGMYNELSSTFTRIALAPGSDHDGNLEVHELLSGVNFDGVNLVVLSACETSLGRHSGGDEIVSLARAILYAGSPAVISTLWRIDDLATAELMVSFYRELRAGQPAADALRRAQLSLLRGARFQEPSFWAAFTLTGDSTVTSTHPASSDGKRALLIGIGEYPKGSGWHRISAVEDLSEVGALLERQGFPAGAVTYLRNEQATRAEIVRAIEERLIEPALPGELAVLLFAGHGLQMRDEDAGEEVDGWDEVLVPYDAPHPTSGAAGEGRYLRDDALRELLERLRRRLGPTGQVVVLLDSCHSGTGARGNGRGSSESGFLDRPRGAGARSQELAPLVVLSAARAGERAFEPPVRSSGKPVGSLSWAFCRALEQSPIPATYRALGEAMRAELYGKVSNQVQVEGALDAPLFLGEPVDEKPYFAVLPVDGEERRVRLRPGLLAGLMPATELEIHPAGAAGPAAGEPLAKARVVETSPHEALADLSSPLARETLSSARAFVTRDAAGDLGPRLALNRYLRQLELSDPRLEAELEVMPGEVLEDHGADQGTQDRCVVNEGPGKTAAEGEIEMPVGSCFELRVRLGGEPAFLTVLDLTSDGAISVLWPPEGARERTSQAPAAVHALDQFFAVVEPCGTDVLLLIASVEPIDFSPLRRLDPAAFRRGEREKLGPFAPLIDPAFLRGGPPPSLTTTAVSTSRLVLRVVPAHHRPAEVSAGRDGSPEAGTLPQPR